MPKKQPKGGSAAAETWYEGAEVPLAAIRGFARAVAERFRPDKVILFGSYAYGQPHAESDVDILVVMPTRSQVGQAVRIRLAVPAAFPMDLMVRTPQSLARRLEMGDPFLHEITARGIVLYEKDDPGVGAQGRGRLSRRHQARARPRSTS
jgi:predicted nucleotidyltransferase